MFSEHEDPAAPNTIRTITASKRRQIIIIVLVCHALILLDYAWLVRLGSSARLPAHTDYYDQLASAFSHGQLFLDEKPAPAVTALSNPYDPAQRAGIDIPMDVSLYRGKYYFYFGPTPALILLGVKAFLPGRIGDQYLVFLFSYGIFLFQSLLIIKLWRRFFSQLSPWLVGACILLAGLIAPFSWVTGKPNIYNAAITGGQFFFLAGLYTAFDALHAKSISGWRLALTGLLWSAALGGRITLLLPIGFMSFMMLMAALQKHGRAGMFSKTVPAMAALGLTLGLGLASIGWYDWARFGSVSETGIKYQLAGPDIQAHQSDLFSPSYVLQNLYNYVVNRPALRSVFPYMYSATGKVKSVLTFVTLPDFYHAERITGILYAAPFTLLGIVPAIGILLGKPRGRARDDRYLFQWIITSLYGVFFLTFAFFLAFFWAAERYLVDFLPCLVLLSVMGYWQLAELFNQKPVGRMLYIFGGISLMAISIVVSNLLALGSSPLQY